jgi:hypothetical protein
MEATNNNLTKENKMTNLTGTEKQISYANDLLSVSISEKQDELTSVTARIAKWHKKDRSSKSPDQIETANRVLGAMIDRQSRLSMIIDVLSNVSNDTRASNVIDVCTGKLWDMDSISTKCNGYIQFLNLNK